MTSVVPVTRTRIKICGITREEDAVAAARLGADAIGLIFYEGSARHVTVDRAARIARDLPPFVTVVGLFVDPAAEAVRSVLERVPLDLLQFHGSEAPEFCGSFGHPYIKAIPAVPGGDLLQSAAPFAAARGILVDAYVPGVRGGSGVTADWSVIPRSFPRPVILAGGLHPGNVADAVRAVRPWAVDVSSGVERAKGVKDHDKLTAFVRGVHDADV
ncbi:MAG: phosphoribosylanthranilate isomerase [Betaproteobacteria bacterium]|nr:phosphoribosylanthranilate isomerase [Betaproteobacteria bacterium]